MFLNCSNHRIENWSKEQIKEAEKYGKVVEYPFPYVTPQLDEEAVYNIASKAVEEIYGMNPDIVMCQGEFTLTYKIIEKLKELNIKVVAACSDRVTTEAKQADGSNKKIAEFKFIRFREY